MLAPSYRLYHWQMIDTFVYFAHHLVTIPPPGWTNVAHASGTQVLGTVITEHEAGAKVCAEVLASRQDAEEFADKLVQIASYYGFDGWLLNIENSLPAPLLRNLRPFVAYLTERMHASKPGSLVLWYDAVTTRGELQWQNALHADLNKDFFDACDGIFTNYAWTPTPHLQSSAKLAGAEGRRLGC